MSLPQNIQVTMSASHLEQPSESSPPPTGALGTQSWHQQELHYLCELCTSPRHSALPPQPPVPASLGPSTWTSAPSWPVVTLALTTTEGIAPILSWSRIALCGKKWFPNLLPFLILCSFFFPLLGIFWCRYFLRCDPNLTFLIILTGWSLTDQENQNTQPLEHHWQQ